jgi:hypothetical protein
MHATRSLHPWVGVLPACGFSRTTLLPDTEYNFSVSPPGFITNTLVRLGYTTCRCFAGTLLSCRWRNQKIGAGRVDKDAFLEYLEIVFLKFFSNLSVGQAFPEELAGLQSIPVQLGNTLHLNFARTNILLNDFPSSMPNTFEVVLLRKQCHTSTCR